MQSTIDIATIGKGHQTLVYDTEKKDQVEETVQTLMKKYNTHTIYGKPQGSNEAVSILKKDIREFVQSDKYTEKALVETLGGG